jgi:hypothetical protein
VWSEAADAPAGVTAQVIAAREGTLQCSLHRQQACKLQFFKQEVYC